MTEDARRPRWALIALLVGVGVVVIIALIAVFARGGPTQYAADTPEGVVQRYAQAVMDGDTETAMAYLVPEAADACVSTPGGDGDYRLTLVESTEHDESARVDVLIGTVYASGPLGSSEYEYEGTFDLVKDGDSWLIKTAPWEFTICEQAF